MSQAFTLMALFIEPPNWTLWTRRLPRRPRGCVPPRRARQGRSVDSRSPSPGEALSPEPKLSTMGPCRCPAEPLASIHHTTYIVHKYIYNIYIYLFIYLYIYYIYKEAVSTILAHFAAGFSNFKSTNTQETPHTFKQGIPTLED